MFGSLQVKPYLKIGFKGVLWKCFFLDKIKMINQILVTLYIKVFLLHILHVRTFIITINYA